MKRLALEKLIEWKNSPHRKPLILKGARQVGKTWLLKEFAKTSYEHLAYFNFDEHPEYKEFFESSKNTKRILENLQMASGQYISYEEPDKTLIVFDEIQECPKALGALKYFCEHAPQFHIAGAGSLLGIALSKNTSFPVGKIDFLNLYPMNFTEFLLAQGLDNLVQYCMSIQSLEPIPESFFNPLYEQLKMYFITGGMPEAVKLWAVDKNPEASERALLNILDAYQRDFAKHPEPRDFPKISLIWQSLPSQLARENKKFLYQTVKKGARAREYEFALQWLCDAGLVYKVFRSKKPALPLSSYDNLSAFKLFMLDIGLLRMLSRLDSSAFAEGNRLFQEFKGALTENYILQALTPQVLDVPRYWAVDNPSYEVDFLVQHKNFIYPVEVKSGENIKSTSLKKYHELFPNTTPLRIRFSLKNLQLDGDILNIPIFLADHFINLINLV